MKKSNKKAIFGIALLALASVSLASCNGVNIFPTKTQTQTDATTPVSTTPAETSTSTIEPVTSTTPVTSTSSTEPVVSTTTAEPVTTTTEPVVTTTEPVTTTTTEPPVTTTTSGTTTTSSGAGAEYPAENYSGVLVQGKAYTGDYYNSITQSILNDSTTLKSTLNTLVNPSNLKIWSYATDLNRLKTIDSYDEDYVECIYTGERIEKDQSGSATGSWNREHIWAKTYGFGEQKTYESSQPWCDLGHLRVSEANINSRRNDSYFDEITSPTGTDNFGNKWTDSVFEPRDCVKGDIARCLFYMMVKYEDPELVDLELSDDITAIMNSKKQKGGVAYLGKLSTLIKWHYQDPVDSREISRNNGVFATQNNRNPFIDHPEYVYYLYTNESAQYMSLENLSRMDCYVTYDEAAKTAAEALVTAIGTVEFSATCKAKIDAARAAYNALDGESKSFYKKYRALITAEATYAALEDAANQDTTKNAVISFVGITDKKGTIQNNGVELSFTGASNHATYGIYAQAATPFTGIVTGLYNTLKSVTFTYDSNGDAKTLKIEITDGTNKVEATDSITSKNTSQTKNVTLEGLDLTKTITIKVFNTTASSPQSIRISNITFNV